MAQRRRRMTGDQIGQDIRRYRRAAGLSQRQLAEAARLGLGTLRDLEQGRTLWPRWDSVEALATALGLKAGRAWPGSIVQPPGDVAIELQILGPIAVTRSGEPVELGPRRPRAILGLLALRRDGSVRLAELTDMFWGSQPPATAATAVHGYISQLRRTLGSAGHHDLVVWTGHGYRLQAGQHCRLDRVTFEELARGGHEALDQADHVAACDLYEGALSLWRGSTLEDVETLHDHPVVVDLNTRRADVVIRYAHAAARARSRLRVLPHLRDLCAREPFNEQAAAQLMCTLAATGRRAAAITEFERLRSRLAGELGIAPGHQAAAAYAQVTGAA
jgi:DNA-binding SARP family transcriptional activator